jgi:hypothetical protein
MKTAFTTLLLALLAGAALAQQKPIAQYSWKELVEAGTLKTGTMVTLPDKTEALKIENPSSRPLMVTLLPIEQPKITADVYSISGEVRYEGVEGDGFLEMWNYFGESAYFSRTLGESGPMGKLSGTSDWRAFVLPFNATGAKSHPTKLVINLHLPGKGVVYLRSPIKLSQASESSAPGMEPKAWWSRDSSTLAQGIISGLVGGYGVLIGWLSSRGKARAFVLGSLQALIAAGAAGTALGLIAMLVQQPFAVWRPLLLFGVIFVVMLPFTLRSLKERYRRFELRRMTSLDAA